MALIKGFPHDGIVTINRVILKKGRTLDELQERVALMCECKNISLRNWFHRWYGRFEQWANIE